MPTPTRIAPLIVSLMLLAASCGPAPSASGGASASASSPTTSAATPSSAAPTAASAAPSGAASAATSADPTRRPEDLADALASRLAASDYSGLRALITTQGWTGAYYRGEGTARLSPDDTIQWLRSRAKDGNLRVTVEARPIVARELYQPLGEFYIRSTWRDFQSTPEQRVHLMLRQDPDGWHWSGALFNAPT